MHNAEYSQSVETGGRRWNTLEDRWLDAEFQVESFARSIRGARFLAETFPVFWPNLGPGVYASFHGVELIFGEVTSWTVPQVRDWSDIGSIRFDPTSIYYRKIDELTALALERCPGKFLVGYTDLHGGLDCVADWRDPQQLCLDTVDAPERVHELVRFAEAHFLEVFDHYDALLKARGQPSVTWMGIPSFGRLHIPSCDFAALVSPRVIEEFYLPTLHKEVRAMSHNIYHLDGKGTLRHLDRILEVPEIQAIQWVQGMGKDMPILQWMPLLRRIQAAGKSVVVDLSLDELEEFIDGMQPGGLFLCIAAEPELQPDIMKRIEIW
ncbi:MAG: hypothetical protein ACP5XB_14785 [Isosphaeraceae bacterium]